MDEDGESNVDSPILNKIGIKITGETIGAFGKQDSNWLNHDAHNYFRLPKERHEILNGFENTDILPFGGDIQIVQSSGVLQPIASYIPSFPIYPPEFSWIREEREDIKPIYAGTLESGSRVVYYAGDIDRCYGKELIPDHGDLLANSVRWASKHSIPITLKGFGHINVNFYIQEDKYIIHLVNLSGCNCPPGSCEETIPVGPIIVMFQTDYIGAMNAKLTVSEKAVSLMSEGNMKSFIIETLNDHEMIIIERG